MSKVESIEAFYQRKFDWMPDHLRSEIGHFNVFSLEPLVGNEAKPVPYKRRDYNSYFNRELNKVYKKNNEIILEHLISEIIKSNRTPSEYSNKIIKKIFKREIETKFKMIKEEERKIGYPIYQSQEIFKLNILFAANI